MNYIDDENIDDDDDDDDNDDDDDDDIDSHLNFFVPDSYVEI